MSASLTEHLAERLSIHPENAQRALQDLLGRVHQQLQQTSQAAITGLGLFWYQDGALHFQPEEGLARSINHRFEGLQPLTVNVAGLSSREQSAQPPFATPPPVMPGTPSQQAMPPVPPPAEPPPVAPPPAASPHTPPPAPPPSWQTAQPPETDHPLGPLPETPYEEADFAVMNEGEPPAAMTPPPPPPSGMAPDVPASADDLGTTIFGAPPAFNAPEPPASEAPPIFDPNALGGDPNQPLQPAPESDFGMPPAPEQPYVPPDPSTIIYGTPPDLSAGNRDSDVGVPPAPEQPYVPPDPSSIIYGTPPDLSAGNRDSDVGGPMPDPSGTAFPAQPMHPERDSGMMAVPPPQEPTTPPLTRQRPQPAPAPERNQMALVLLGIGALIIFGGGLFYYFTQDDDAADTPALVENPPPDTLTAAAPVDTAAVVPEPEPVPVVPSDIDRQAGGFSLVTASETSEGAASQAAEALRSRLGDAGVTDHPVDVLQGVSGGTTRYRIAIGQFTSEQAALQAKNGALRNHIPADAWVIRIRQNM